jgi:2-methylisocitrate lyase-like PEP mutase family enzyme
MQVSAHSCYTVNMNMTERLNRTADSFQMMHIAPPILVLANAWDAASARVFEGAGARAIGTTSAGIAAVLGYPDGQKVPRELMLEAIARIAGTVDVPVTADVEAGYGPRAEDVAETTRLVIEAGAVGINLEDASGNPAQPLFEVEEQIERIRAAREAAEQAGVRIVINARTDFFLAEIGPPAERLNAAVSRANAYRRAGADCLFVPGVADLATIGTLVRDICGPVNVLASRGTPAVRDLEQIGVARLSVGSGIMRGALALARDAAHELFDQGSYGTFLEKAISYGEVNELMRKRQSSVPVGRISAAHGGSGSK